MRFSRGGDDSGSERVYREMAILSLFKFRVSFLTRMTNHISSPDSADAESMNKLGCSLLIRRLEATNLPTVEGVGKYA